MNEIECISVQAELDLDAISHEHSLKLLEDILTDRCICIGVECCEGCCRVAGVPFSSVEVKRIIAPDANRDVTVDVIPGDIHVLMGACVSVNIPRAPENPTVAARVFS